MISVSAEETVKEMTVEKQKRQRKLKRAVFIVGMMALPVIQWLIFWLYVNINSIILAFKDARTMAWTFDNFREFFEALISPTGTINLATINTMKYFFTSLIIILPTSIIMSYFLYKKVLLYKVYRVVFYLPAIISGIIMVTAYCKFIDPDGPLGIIMGKLGRDLPAQGLLARDESATNMIIIYVIWTGFCGNVLFFSGAMARVPMEVLESARLDGCTAFRELIQMIIPLIWPTISTLIITTFTGLFTASGPILLFTSGFYKTTTISYWIFTEVYGEGGYGGSGTYGLVSAAGLCFTCVSVPIIMLVRWLIDKVPAVEY